MVKLRAWAARVMTPWSLALPLLSVASELYDRDPQWWPEPTSSLPKAAEEELPGAVLHAGAWECACATLVWRLGSFSGPRPMELVDWRLPRGDGRREQSPPGPALARLRLSGPTHKPSVCWGWGPAPCGVWLPRNLSPVTKSRLGCRIPQKSGHSGVTAKAWPVASPQQELGARLSSSISLRKLGWLKQVRMRGPALVPSCTQRRRINGLAAAQGKPPNKPGLTERQEAQRVSVGNAAAGGASVSQQGEATSPLLFGWISLTTEQWSPGLGASFKGGHQRNKMGTWSRQDGEKCEMTSPLMWLWASYLISWVSVSQMSQV